jgi:hypothetical protein
VSSSRVREDDWNPNLKQTFELNILLHLEHLDIQQYVELS